LSSRASANGGRRRRPRRPRGRALPTAPRRARSACLRGAKRKAPPRRAAHRVRSSSRRARPSEPTSRKGSKTPYLSLNRGIIREETLRVSMRRLIVILLSALAVVPAALAAGQATGDGVLELKAAYGTIGIGRDLQPARGILWGQMDKGKLV